jgi:hypothetical protein
MSAPLSPQGRELLETLFDRAADLPPAEHAAFVARECGDDAVLRSELLQLLAGLAGADTQFEPDTSLRPGTLVGSYKLLERIGEGSNQCQLLGVDGQSVVPRIPRVL